MVHHGPSATGSACSGSSREQQRSYASASEAIEAGAIAAAMLARRGQLDGALLAGSVKANVGHTESASGMMGMTKLLCAMRRAHVAPRSAQDANGAF